MLYRETDIFVSGQGGYHTYRIPALAVTTKGTILAFCEGRKFSSSDSGDIDLVLKRSLDNGKTWAETQIVWDEGPDTAGNPAPVVDRATGTIWLGMCKNLAQGHEGLICQGKAPRTAWMTRSDDGATWAQPVEITKDVKKPSWTWYATGPCHGIQLSSGRLVLPCDHIVGVKFDRKDPYHSHVILSDDHGLTWRIGGIVPDGTNESVIVETVDGALYINCRNYLGAKRRAFAWSYDGGESFTDFGYDETLVEPICQASMVRFTDEKTGDRNRVLFSNPASTNREKMTVRLSYDECRSWNAGRLLHAGPSAYSELCVVPDMTVGCLYERGQKTPYERITFAQFDLEWLTDGKERL
jgi:sialidase-1